MASGVFDASVFDCAVFDCGGKSKPPDQEDFVDIWTLLHYDEEILTFIVNAVISGILEE